MVHAQKSKKSQKEVAQKQEREKQNAIHSEVESQREAVQDAQWKFFCTALRQDQAMLSKVKMVPEKVKAKLHEKAVLQRKQQSEAGAKATSGYQDRWTFHFKTGTCVFTASTKFSWQHPRVITFQYAIQHFALLFWVFFFKVQRRNATSAWFP